MRKNPVTPVLRRKRRPRGRPFAKGNKFGVRFVKGGPSPNAGGRPKSAQFAEAARRVLNSPLESDPSLTVAEALALKLAKKALNGHVASAELLVNYAEGKPAVNDGLPQRDDPLMKLIESMDRIAASSPPVPRD